jgi:hypothetical protein
VRETSSCAGVKVGEEEEGEERRDEEGEEKGIWVLIAGSE